LDLAYNNENFMMKAYQHCALLFLLAAPSQGVVIDVSGNFRDYSRGLRDQALGFGESRVYDAPNQSQRQDFAQMVTHLAAGQLDAADAIASDPTINYEVVRFTDTSPGGSMYYHLRERTVAAVEGQRVDNGWGSYFFNPNATSPVIVQAPHILHDTHSYDVATVAFANSGATAMFFNGAHRDSGGAQNSDVSDVAHLSTSVFQTAHETLTTTHDLQAWQIHGFNIDNAIHATVPAGTDAILSNGDGSVSDEIMAVAATIGQESFIGDASTLVGAFNTLNVNDPDNVAVNGNVPGSAYQSLGGTLNEQGIFTRAQGGIFVHIELEQSIRLDQNLANDLLNRERAGLAIAAAIDTVPEPTGSVLILLGTVLSGLRRRR